jgi:hypothetical protein
MRQRPGSVVEITGPDGTVVEMHCVVCAHCQRMTNVPSLRRLADFSDVCRGCMRLVCDKCAGGPCTPWLKQVEAMEDRARFRRECT